MATLPAPVVRKGTPRDHHSPAEPVFRESCQSLSIKCDDCQRNENGKIEWVSVTKLTGSQARIFNAGFPSQFDHYAVNSHYEPYDLPPAEVCEAVGMRWVCDLVDTNTVTGRRHAKMCQFSLRSYELYKYTNLYKALCANRALDNPNPRTGIYRLGAGNL